MPRGTGARHSLPVTLKTNVKKELAKIFKHKNIFFSLKKSHVPHGKFHIFLKGGTSWGYQEGWRGSVNYKKK